MKTRKLKARKEENILLFHGAAPVGQGAMDLSRIHGPVAVLKNPAYHAMSLCTLSRMNLILSVDPCGLLPQGFPSHL